MIPALGTFVSGLTTHTLHTLSFFHSRHCATNSPWIPSTLGSPLPGLSVKRFLWNSNTGLVIVNKGDIDWQVSTGECGHRDWWLGGERVDDPHQSVSRCPDYSAVDCGVSSRAFSLSSHQIPTFISFQKYVFCRRSYLPAGWDHSSWLRRNFSIDFPQIRRCYLAATLSCSPISSAALWNLLKHDERSGKQSKCLNT